MWNLSRITAVLLTVGSYHWTTVLAVDNNDGSDSDAISPSPFTYHGKKWQNINITEKSTILQTPITPTVQNNTCPLCTCGTLGKKLGIVGGNSTYVNEYSWMAMLLNNSEILCGGSLINDKYVLTAAHCVDGGKKEDIIIRLLEYDWTTTTEEKSEDYKVLEMIIHEEYNPVEQTNDIALLRLDTTKVLIGPESKIHPVCLPEKGNSYDGYLGIVVGWGFTREYYGPAPGPDSKTLLQVDVPILSNDECNQFYNETLIADTMLCAGYEDGGKDSCQGDSGGPLHIIENEYYHVAGIVSWGFGCAMPKYPGVYTRVNKYLDWLAVNTEDACSCNNVNNMSKINIHIE